MTESKGTREVVIYRDKLINLFLSPEGGFYTSIAALDGEVESYISRSESAEEALCAAKAAIDAQSLILI